MTLGTRIIVTNKEGAVLLVRHTYIDGWHLPGGGVDVGENCDDAALRELREETGVELAQAPALIGVFFNRKASKRDHVMLYACKVDDPKLTPPTGREIAEIGFYGLDALPAGTTESTRQRLDEYFEKSPKLAYW